jgi:hypothetical protein
VVANILDTMKDEMGKEHEDELSPIESPEQGIRKIANNLLMDAVGIVSNSMKFADLDPVAEAENGNWEPPESWVKELGLEEAKRAHRLAKYAMMPSKDVPEGLKMAHKTLLGAMKVILDAGDSTGKLGVSLVSMPPIDDNYQIIEVEEDER